jgi:lipopolysaccharide/colanic/teichoic acid biosynthesis glycosyltransferase
MWLGGCAVAALLGAFLSQAGEPWLVGIAAIVAAQGAMMVGRAARLPIWAAWPLVAGSVAVGALSFHGAEIALYLGLTALLLLLTAKFATLAIGLSAFCLPASGPRLRNPGTMTLTDPVAREFAHARREGSELSVASLSVPAERGLTRRLAQIARELVPRLRRSDVIVRAVTDRLVVVFPRADADVAKAVLTRALAGGARDLQVGIATFPEDALTWTGLKDVAREREAPWMDTGGGPGPGVPAPASSATGEEQLTDEGDRPPVLFEIRVPGRYLRRATDLVVLALAAPIVLPLIALMAAAVKLDSPGPAFVRIVRVGQNGKPFELFKLRTMTADAEARKESLRHLNTLPWPDFKIVNDPRTTRVGRWLRPRSLDEVPQLLNVLRGEMTLVGPRPCSVRLGDYEPWQGERLEVTPGLAGSWQAEGRGSADFATRCRLDIRQAQGGSIRVNLMLVIATLRSVLRSRGAL